MIDIKLIRTDVNAIIKQLNTRNNDYSKEILKIYNEDILRRDIISKLELLKANKNNISKEIGKLKSQGKDTSSILKKMKDDDNEILSLNEKLSKLESSINETLSYLPNLPAPDTPIGKDESENLEIKKWGTPRKFTFAPKAHWDLMKDLDIVDLERAAKLSGSRFVLYKGDGAKLERALINFMLDYHTSHGYKEILPPFVVLPSTMYGTGQLPKFKEDMYHTDDDLYLISTAEIPVTNIHRQEILDYKDLPIKYVAYTPSFRKESGSAGKDTRGIIRVHQFDKVELVKITAPESSDAEAKALLHDAEQILVLLGLPYRVIHLCTGDLGFSSCTTYDIEVYLPSYGTYKEISSCSNYSDFQARRMETRFKRNKDSKTELVHTNNGSGLAVGRTFAAILENYQNEDGSITIPKVLVPYMGKDKIS